MVLLCLGNTAHSVKSELNIVKCDFFLRHYFYIAMDFSEMFEKLSNKTMTFRLCLAIILVRYWRGKKKKKVVQLRQH